MPRYEARLLPLNSRCRRHSMQLIYHSDFLAHDTGGHPERKERLHAFRGIARCGFLPPM